MSTEDEADRSEHALQRVRAAIAERDNAMNKIKELTALIDHRFWTRVIGEIGSGQLSQAEVVDALGLTRETVRQRARAHVPQAPVRPARPRSSDRIYFAIGMRLLGEDTWRAEEEPCAGRPTLTLPGINRDNLPAPSPYLRFDLEYAYRELSAEEFQVTKSYIPTWPAALHYRPLFMSDTVFSELYGPRIVGSAEWLAWEQRVATLPPAPSSD